MKSSESQKEVFVMADQTASPLLTAEEVGKILRLKPATVYEAASVGRIPCVRLWKGRRKTLVRFRVEDIDRIIQERVVSAPNAEE